MSSNPESENKTTSTTAQPESQQNASDATTSPKNTFLIMKAVAVALIVAVFATLFYNSKLHNFIFTSTERARIPNLGPAEARPTALALPPEAETAYDGHVTHLVFWAEWCEPCARELPMIEQAVRTHGASGLQVVLINLDDPEDQEKAKNLQMALAPGSAAIYEDTEELKFKFNVTALPYHIFVDKKGRTATAFFADISKHEEQFKSLLLQLLAE